jgi:hypothetical protein
MKTIRIYKLAAMGLLLSFGLTSCDDLLEPAQENLKNLEETQKESSSVRGFLTNAYRVLPAYYDNSDYATDDAVTNQKDNGFLLVATGGWTADNGILSRWNDSYAAIQYVNLFLKTREGQQYVKNLTVNELLTQRLLGEAYALRGIHLYYLLRAHAGFTTDGVLKGVQLFDGFVDTNSDFNQSRASFADCVRKALEDLDQAVKLLPFDYGDISSEAEIPAKFRNITTDPSIYNQVMGNKSRQLVNSQIVESFRSRLLLLAASPAFKADTNPFTWAEAADAAATVIDNLGGVSALPSNGITYYTNGDIENIKEGSNPAEILWRSNWEDNSTTQESENFPPSLFGNGRMNPTQNLVDAFPAANGYPITDAASGYDPANPYENRDPRLRAYILVNGDAIGVNNKVINTQADSDPKMLDGLNKENGRSTTTGYYLRKTLRSDVNLNPVTDQRHFGIRIRTTELLLDYAEAANEAQGPTAQVGGANYSAYDIIKAIRARVHDAGWQDPYLESIKGDQAKMRELIRNERRLELCFENHRFWDLRRWKANLNEGAKGASITSTGAGVTNYNIISVEPRQYQDYMIYGPIPYSEVLKWSNLQQNDGWSK